jgi:hypothetical protein
MRHLRPSSALTGLVALLLAACEEVPSPMAPGANPDVDPPTEASRLAVPGDHPGNPFYALIFNGLEPESPHFFFPHDEGWGAAAFERELWCVPSDFNLLEEFDFTPAFPGGPPRPFLCPLTVEGFHIWDNPPSPLPVDPGPIMVLSRGLGAVPVVFAHWPELVAAMADGVLTLPELLALPSAIVGTADRFSAQYVNGPPPDDRLMNMLTAHGDLPDGRSFRVQATESQADTRYRIEIR